MEVFRGYASGDAVFLEGIGNLFFNRDTSYPFGYFYDRIKRKEVFLIGECCSSHYETAKEYNFNSWGDEEPIDLNEELNYERLGRVFFKNGLSFIVFWEKIPERSVLREIYQKLHQGLDEVNEDTLILKDYNVSSNAAFNIVGAFTIKELLGYNNNLCNKYKVDDLYQARQLNRLYQYGYVDENMIRSIVKKQLRDFIG